MTKQNPNTMQVTILDDGTVKIETSNMAGISHKAADDMILWFSQQLGVEPEKIKLEAPHQHTHSHSHGHEHKH